MTAVPKITGLDDVRRLLMELPGPDTDAEARAAAREQRLTKPRAALGRLEHLTAWLCGWQGRHPPRLDRVTARIFAGNHGVAKRGVSAYPAAVTAQMVANFRNGGAAVSQLCRLFDVELEVHAVDLDHPTEDFTVAPALGESACIDALLTGIAAVDGDVDLLCLGEMGIGNTTAAAALAACLYGGSAEDWTGPGTGVEGDALARKRTAVAEAVDRHACAAVDPLDLLRRIGGRELVAIAGAVLAARWQRIPVLLDGYVCTAAAAVLQAMRPGALDHCQVGHVSAEPGHRLLLERLGKRPILELDMRLGEASGAVVAAAIVRAAVACHLGMATFEEAGVSDRGGS